MSWAAWSGWSVAAPVVVCAAVGLWHHRRDGARLARCVHELRGPLGALRLGLDLAIAQGGLAPERLHALDLQLTRATVALDDLGGGGGRLTAAAQLVQVDALLRDCVAALAPIGAIRGVAVQVGQAPDVGVLGSRARLAQALGNLIENAIEHGAGPVCVQARGAGGSVRVEVADQGAGLPRPLSEILGGGRRREWAAATSAHGHGLAVAASVAAAHSGRLLSAPSDRGARLVLELPAEPVAAAQPRGLG